MKEAIDNKIKDINRKTLYWSWYKTETLREFIMASDYNYFGACDYVESEYGYLLTH